MISSGVYVLYRHHWDSYRWTGRVGLTRLMDGTSDPRWPRSGLQLIDAWNLWGFWVHRIWRRAECHDPKWVRQRYLPALRLLHRDRSESRVAMEPSHLRSSLRSTSTTVLQPCSVMGLAVPTPRTVAAHSRATFWCTFSPTERSALDDSRRGRSPAPIFRWRWMVGGAYVGWVHSGGGTDVVHVTHMLANDELQPAWPTTGWRSPIRHEAAHFVQ